MKNKYFTLFILPLVFWNSCTPLVTTKLEENITASNVDDPIVVFGLHTSIPADAEVIGTIKIGDTGFTITNNCSFQDVLDLAKMEAKKAGGNAIKITDHIPPGNSTCHRITAKILRLPDTKTVTNKELELQKNTYSILNLFCKNDSQNIKYDLYLNDSIIWNVKNNLKTTIAIRKEGINTFRAQVDKTTELKINIEFGQVYYLKCDILIKDGSKQPFIELVNQSEGSLIFDIFGN